MAKSHYKIDDVGFPVGFQWVYWGPWYSLQSWWFGFVRFDPKITCMAYIYDWSIRIGLIEIRKWTKRKVDET